MMFLSLWQRLANHYFGWHYVVFSHCYDIQVYRAFIHNDVIYAKTGNGYKSLQCHYIIFTTLKTQVEE